MLEKLRVWLWPRLPLSAGGRSLLLRLFHGTFVVGAAALIFDEQGRVLVVRHPYRKPFAWGLPGGLVQRRESIKDAVLRELREETGLEARVEDLFLVTQRIKRGALTLTFRCTLTGGRFRPSAEVSEMRFVPIEELPRFMSPQSAEVVHRLLTLAESGALADLAGSAPDRGQEE